MLFYAQVDYDANDIIPSIFSNAIFYAQVEYDTHDIKVHVSVSIFVYFYEQVNYDVNDKILSYQYLFIFYAQVDYDANDIIVSVSILGTALITGNVQTPVTQVPLSQAVTGLTNAINLGKFVVTVAVGSKVSQICIITMNTIVINIISINPTVLQIIE